MQYGSFLDDDGGFEITAVIPGEYLADVSVRSDRPRFGTEQEYQAEPIDVLVPPGGLDGLELRPRIRALPVKVQFAGRIELPADVPQAVSELFLRRTDDPKEELRVDVRVDRSFTGRVPAGEYRVWVLPSWESVVPELVTIAEDGWEDAVLRFRRAPEEDASSGDDG